MSDTDQNLFAEATENTLEQFENAPTPPSIEQPPSEPETPEPEEDTTAHVPSGRLREEADARRRAEREAADLRAQLAAFQAVRQQQPAQPQKPVDIFDNPQNFVQQQFQPVIEQMRAENQWRQEQMSRDNAIGRYGDQTVAQAYQALQQGVQMNDPATMNVWQASLNHYDPYGMIVRWHTERQMLREVGNDLNGYRQRVVQEAMKDPEFQKQFMNYMRSNTSQQVNQPARNQNTSQFTQSKVPYVPSLSDMGTSAPDEQISDASDEALFRAAVSAKRRK